MNVNLSKEEIIRELTSVTKEFYSFCETIHDEHFFMQPSTKWSIAQDVKHLITSAGTTRLAFTLPQIYYRALHWKT